MHYISTPPALITIVGTGSEVTKGLNAQKHFGGKLSSAALLYRDTVKAYLFPNTPV